MGVRAEDRLAPDPPRVGPTGVFDRRSRRAGPRHARRGHRRPRPDASGREAGELSTLMRFDRPRGLFRSGENENKAEVLWKEVLGGNPDNSNFTPELITRRGVFKEAVPGPLETGRPQGRAEQGTGRLAGAGRNRREAGAARHGRRLRGGPRPPRRDPDRRRVGRSDRGCCRGLTPSSAR